MVKMPMGDFVREHHHLINVLKHGSRKTQRAEAKSQARELSQHMVGGGILGNMWKSVKKVFGIRSRKVTPAKIEKVMKYPDTVPELALLQEKMADMSYNQLLNSMRGLSGGMKTDIESIWYILHPEALETNPPSEKNKELIELLQKEAVRKENVENETELRRVNGRLVPAARRAYLYRSDPDARHAEREVTEEDVTIPASRYRRRTQELFHLGDRTPVDVIQTHLGNNGRDSRGRLITIRETEDDDLRTIQTDHPTKARIYGSPTIHLIAAGRRRRKH